MKEVLLEQILKATQLNKTEALEFLSMGNQAIVIKKKLFLKPGEVADKGYFLISGTIRHYTQNATGQFTKNLIRGPRFMLPSLTSFFLERPSRIYCEALTELKVIEWNRKDLLGFADEHPKMYKFLLKAVVRAFHSKEMKEITLNQMSAKQRYLRFMDEFPNLVNEIPIQYVASYLGVRPETLSRIRSKLTS